MGHLFLRLSWSAVGVRSGFQELRSLPPFLGLPYFFWPLQRDAEFIMGFPLTLLLNTKEKLVSCKEQDTTTKLHIWPWLSIVNPERPGSKNTVPAFRENSGLRTISKPKP